MKKQKSLEDLTHQDLIEGLIYDENIQDNINVSNDYAEDQYGNNLVTMYFEGKGTKRKKGNVCLILFTFNRKGRLIGIETAMRAKGERNWQVATSQEFADFTARFGSDAFNAALDRKKRGN